jgi:microcystin-dependent protein
MAVITETDDWSPVYELATSDPVKGGPVAGSLSAPTDGFNNAAAQGLADRTLFLYNRLQPIGSIVMYGGTSAPTGWKMCDGSAISRSTYDALFAVVGENFGQGNGTTTFNLPDLRGQFVRGVDNGAGTDPDAGSRTAMATGGNTGDAVGSVQDEEFKEHNHDVNGEGGLNSTLVAATSNNSTTPSTITTENAGGSETRPTNAALNFIIRVDYDQP